jgi:hypothetical protein
MGVATQEENNGGASQVTSSDFKSESIFIIVKPFKQKNLHVHLNNLCAFVQFHKKPIFFVLEVKR